MISFITLLTVAVLVFSLAAAVLAGMKRMEAARCFEATAWFTALGLFAANCKLAESLPFGNMRQVMCFFPLVLGPMSLYMRRWRGTELTACFSGVGVVAMVGALCMPMQATWRQMPALQSAWFAPHVTSYVIAYGLLAVSAVLVVMSFRAKAEERLQAADDLRGGTVLAKSKLGVLVQIAAQCHSLRLHLLRGFYEQLHILSSQI